MAELLDVALSVDALGPRLTGVGRYCLELARGLPLEPDVRQVRYFRGQHWLNDPEALLAESWQPPRRKRWKRLLNNRYRVWQMRNGIVHGPNFFLPAWADCGVITVHDLSVILYPETHPTERVLDFERRFMSSLDRASVIITDSEAVRAEIIAMLGIAAEKVRAVALGVSALAPVDPSTLRQLGLIVGNYCLCVSTFEPRKRIDSLVRAYRLLDPALRRAVPLVLAGASGWRNDSLNALVDKAQSEGWLKRLDYVPDHLLGGLYAGARLFVYPSCYEGFGLPPIEAMQRGVPTIVGHAAALIEVTKGAARVVNADDEDVFARLIADSLEDRSWQAEAARAGQRVAHGYSWSSCVSQTASVYHSIA